MPQEELALRRRASDRSEGQDMSDKEVAANIEKAGITHRIMCATPGSDIVLRKGTTAILYDVIRGITWGDVFHLLVQAGILEKFNSTSGSGNTNCNKGSDDEKSVVWKKREVGQSLRDTRDARDAGSDRNNFPNIKKIIDREENKMLKSLDIKKPEERRFLIKTILERSMRRSILSHGAHDFSHLIDMLTDAVVGAVDITQENSAEHQNQNYTKRSEALMQVLTNNGVVILYRPVRAIYEGVTKKQDIHQMVLAWARDIERAIMNHAS